MSDIFYGSDIPCYLLTDNEGISDIGAAGDINAVIHSDMNLSETMFIAQPDHHEEDGGTVDATKICSLLSVASSFRKPCNCAKSHCLKLYCECFARGSACENCNCTNCLNNNSHEDERRKAIKLTLERNPLAFHPKIGEGEKKHSKGCNCKRSGCLKNYCECYEAKIQCSDLCRCQGCRNFDDGRPQRSNIDIQNSISARSKFTGLSTSYKITDKFITNIQEFQNRAIYLKLIVKIQQVIEAACSCMIAQLTEVQISSPSPVKHQRTVIEEFGRCLEQIIDSALKLKKPNEFSHTPGLGEVDHNLVNLISNYSEPSHMHYEYKGVQPQLGYSTLVSPDASVLGSLHQVNSNHEVNKLSSGNHAITCASKNNEAPVYQKTLETAYSIENFANIPNPNFELHSNNGLHMNVIKVYQEPYACISASDPCNAYSGVNQSQFVNVGQSGYASQLPSIAFNYTDNQSSSILDEYQNSKVFYPGPLALSNVSIGVDRCTNGGLTENLHLSQQLGTYTSRLEEPSGTVMKSYDASGKFHQPFKHTLTEGDDKGEQELNDFTFCSQVAGQSMLSKTLTYDETHAIEDDEQESNEATAALLHATSIYDHIPATRFSVNPDLDMSEMTEIGSVVDNYSADMIPLNSPVSAFPPRLHSGSAFHFVPEDAACSSGLMALSSGVSSDLGQVVLKPELGFYDL